MIKTFSFLAIFLFAFLAKSHAQLAPESELYQTIMRQDSLLFDVGFNTCDIKQFEALLSDRFEFYHDLDGISDREKFLETLKSGLCRDPKNFQARRELLEGSTELYALKDKSGAVYGVIQNGEHRFFEKEGGLPEKAGSTAKFTHLWRLENGRWILSRSYSFSHTMEKTGSTQNPDFGNDAAVEAWLQAQQIPVLGIGVIEEGQLKQVRVFGQIGPGKPAPYNTIFNVASLTKPLTAIVTLKLVSMGKWNLDEPLYKYWTDPEVGMDARNKLLNTRHILSHQSGFPNWRWDHADQKLAFEFSPGTQYQYSGEGYEYLRKALEHKFHKSLQELAQELVFQPLGMQDSRYIWSNKVDSSRLAPGYDENGKAYETIKNKIPNAADELLTTVEDYGRFLVSVMNAEGLSVPVFQEMCAKQVPSSRGKHFGLGFERYELENGEYALSHGGADKGVRTLIVLLPQSKQGLIIFTNSDNGGKVYAALLEHYLGSKGKQIVDIETK